MQSVPLLKIEPLRLEKKNLLPNSSLPDTSATRGANKTCCLHDREHETLKTVSFN